MKTFICPHCGSPLVNGPRFAACNSCQNPETYPKFYANELREHERESLPIAKRMACVDKWWKLSDRPGIWEAKGVANYPSVVKAKYKTKYQINRGSWSIGYFIRAEKAEAELKIVLADWCDIVSGVRT